MEKTDYPAMILLKKYQVIIPETINFNMVPARKPTKEPNSAFKAEPVSLPAINSPTTAPANGKIIMPNGGKIKSPATSPITLPQTPCLLPPNFFVPQMGIR